MLNYTRIPAPRVYLVDPQTGIVSNEWFRFFNNLYTIAYSGANSVTPGTYGTAAKVPQITVDEFGNIIALSELSIAIDASQIVSGTIASARIQGDYLGITGVGTLTTGVWNATTIATPYGGTGLSSYTTGDTLYYASGDALTKIAIGASTYINTSNGTAPQWTDPTTITVGKATNLVGGAANRIAYQTATDTTGFIVAPTVSNTYLEWSGTAFQWSVNPLGTVTSVSVVSANGLAGTVATATTTPAITLSTTVTGLLKGNGTAISAATSGTDYAPATSGTSILYGNGAGGFSNVTIGTGVSFVGGTLSATGSGGTVTSVTGTSPVVSSGGTTPAISLATAYGDTLNPYASKTANYFLAAPNGSAGVPTFRAIVAADIPALSYVTSVSGTGSVNGITLTGTVTSSGSLTLGGTLSGIGNSQLTNSTISGVALGGSLFNLTAGTGVTFSTGTTYNGSAAITINATGSGGTVTSVTGTAPVSVATGTTTPVISMAAANTTTNGYLTSTDWNTFNNKGSGTVTSITSTTLTIGGTSAIPTVNLTSGIATAGTTGSSTLIPVVTIDTYGRVTGITTASNPQGTVTSVAALTLGTTGTDLSSTVATGTTTPVITLNVPTASATNRGALSSTDWSTFNSKAPGVTFTTNYIPYGQGTTTLNQSARLTFDGTNFATTGSATATGFIPSSSTIPTNGMYLPAANSLGLATNSTNAIYISSAQVVGVGVTPSTWASGWGKIIEIGGNGNALISTSGTDVRLYMNNYYNASANNTYARTGAASLYIMSTSGQHQWYTAPSGTAGTSPTFTQRMTLDNNGYLLIGGTSAVYASANRGAVEVNGASQSMFANNIAGTNGGYVYHDGTNYSLMNVKSGSTTIGTNNTTKITVDTNGNMYGLAGTTSMTNGFMYIPSAAGAPSGVPTAVSGRVPMYYDSTNNFFYVYNGAWKKILLA